jgi:hypothetical protein
MFWTAWPAAPFTMLSIAETMIPVLPFDERWTDMSQKFEKTTFLLLAV